MSIIEVLLNGFTGIGLFIMVIAATLGLAYAFGRIIWYIANKK